MPDIVTKDVAEPNDTEKDDDENEDEDEPQLDKDMDKKHNSGAADLEKVLNVVTKHIFYSQYNNK